MGRHTHWWVKAQPGWVCTVDVSEQLVECGMPAVRGCTGETCGHGRCKRHAPRPRKRKAKR